MVRNLNILFAILFGAFSMQLFAAPAKQNNSSDTLSARQKYLVNSTRSIIDNNNLGRYSESINLMMEVEASIDTIDFAPYWTNTGNTQFSLMNYLGAAQRYRKALEPSQKNYYIPKEFAEIYHRSTWLNLGAAYKMLGMQDSALSCFTRTPITDDNKATLANNIATVYMDRHDWDKALSYLTQIDFHPKHETNLGIETNLNENLFIAKQNLMYCYVRLGDIENATKYYTRAYTTYFPFQDTSVAIRKLIDYYVLIEDKNSLDRLIEDYKSFFERRKDEYSHFMILHTMSLNKESRGQRYEEGWNLLRASLAPKSENSLKLLSLNTLIWKELSFWLKLSLILVSTSLIALLFGLGYYLSGALNKSKSVSKAEVSTLPTALAEIEADNDDPLDHFTPEELDFVKSLSLREVQVLKCSIRGRTPKEISVQLNCSSGYVYNMKSTIRKTFEETFPGQDFEDWMKTKSFKLLIK